MVSFPNWQSVVEQARANPEVIGAAPYVEQETMLRARRTSGALVRGIDPQFEPDVSDVDQMMVRGDLTDLVPGEWRVMLGGRSGVQAGRRSG